MSNVFFFISEELRGTLVEWFLMERKSLKWQVLLWFNHIPRICCILVHFMYFGYFLQHHHKFFSLFPFFLCCNTIYNIISFLHLILHLLPRLDMYECARMASTHVNEVLNTESITQPTLNQELNPPLNQPLCQT